MENSSYMIDRIEKTKLDADMWVRAFKYLISIVPYLIGAFVGLAWWLIVYWWRAIVTGFKDVNK